MMNERVVFFSNGVPLIGTLTLPVDEGIVHPGVVLCHGYGSFKDEFGCFTELAEKLSSAGYVVLRFDFRGAGESGVRGRMLPASEWTEDLGNAVTYLQTRPEVDPERIGTVGISGGAGVSIVRASTDARIKCVVCFSAPADAEKLLQDMWTRSFGYEAWLGFKRKVEEDRKTRVRHGWSEYVPFSSIIPYSGSDLRLYQDILKNYPLAMSHASLESPDNAMNLRPVVVIRMISPRPIRLIHGSNDTLTTIAEAKALYENALQPKDLRVIEGGEHALLMDPWKTQSQAYALEWLNRYLK